MEGHSITDDQHMYIGPYKVELGANHRVKVTAPGGGHIQDQSVQAVLLFGILQALQKPMIVVGGG